jgi:hypothetical protein
MAKPPALSLVPGRLDEDEAIEIIRTGNFKEADLIRRSGLSRAKARKLIAEYAPSDRIKLPSRGKLPKVQLPVPVVAAPAEATVVLQPVGEIEAEEPRPSAVLKIIAAGSYLLGAWLLVIGVMVNWQFNASQGHDWMSSFILGGQGAAYDVAPSFLMPFAEYLWSKRQWVMGVVALLLWCACVLMSGITVTSFTSTHVGDAVKSRTDMASRRSVLAAQLAAAQRDLDAAKANKQARDQQIGALTQAIDKTRFDIAPSRLQATHDCDPAQVTLTSSFVLCDPLIQLRAKKADAERLAGDDARKIADLPAEITRLSDKLAELPAVADKNPSGGFSSLTGGWVQPDQVESVKTNGSILTIILPGCLFMFARVMSRRPEPHAGSK